MKRDPGLHGQTDFIVRMARGPRLTANLSLLSCLGEEALCEIEPFLGFSQLLLEALDIMFK